MSNLSFKRSQVEWVIWRWALAGRAVPDAVPMRLKTRINKLLELDRRDASLTSATAQSSFAFLERAPAGTGTDLELTAFDAFCLALACDMLDFGFKQSEVVFLFRHIRGRLEKWFEKALATSASRQRVLSKHVPQSPKDPDDSQFADLSIFMIQERIETTDMLADGASVLREPDFCEGRAALARHFKHFGMSERRQAYVVEIARTAVWISDALQKAPLIKRGRRA